VTLGAMTERIMDHRDAFCVGAAKDFDIDFINKNVIVIFKYYDKFM
jgi:hypothetical protein